MTIFKLLTLKLVTTQAGVTTQVCNHLNFLCMGMLLSNSSFSFIYFSFVKLIRIIGDSLLVGFKRWGKQQENSSSSSSQRYLISF
jgi:hypothetical protein